MNEMGAEEATEQVIATAMQAARATLGAVGGKALTVDRPHGSSDDALMADQITRTELDSKFEAIRADMQAGFAGLRAEFAEDRTMNVKWIVTTGVAMTALVLTGVGVLNTVQRPNATPSLQPAPIVIYAQPPAPSASR